MDLVRWDIALLVGIPPLIAVGVGVFVVRRWFESPIARMRVAARRLGGRLDPAGERARTAAILVELDGRLLRISYARRDGRRPTRGAPPAIEICTPVENSAPLVAAVRVSDESWALDLVGRDVTSEPLTERAHDGVLIYGLHTSLWAAALVRDEPSIAILELDSRMLRVVACNRVSTTLDAAAIERLVLEFSGYLPAALKAAGVSGPSVRRERD
ncbi:MAG TPA: hypothetical protein PLF26_17965 [Blastocatellia bacterium]|nr:hypothetical protein [Blastocatellia bacterium]